MIEGGKYHDSLEKLFTLQTIAESKGLNRYKVVTFDFGSKIFGDLAKPERFFYFFGFMHIFPFFKSSLEF